MAEGEQEDDSQKTEDPTPKKIDEARKKGQVAMTCPFYWMIPSACGLGQFTKASRFLPT